MAERIQDRGNRITGALVMALMLLPATDAPQQARDAAACAGAQLALHAGRTRRASAGRVAAPRPGQRLRLRHAEGRRVVRLAERCLRELCAGGNFTNRYVDGFRTGVCGGIPATGATPTSTSADDAAPTSTRSPASAAT